MPKDSGISNGRARTEDLRREIDRAAAQRDWRRPFRSRRLGIAILIWTAFVVVTGSIAVWTREQPLVGVGRVMRETRTVRTSFEVTDEAATDQARNSAKIRASRVYIADRGVMTEIGTSLENLPRALAGVESLEGVEEGLRQQFGLTQSLLESIKAQAVDGEASPAWLSRVQRLAELLTRTPIIERQVYQVETTSPNLQMELRINGRPPILVPSKSAIDVESPKLADDLRMIASSAGFEPPLLEAVVNRLVSPARPTYTFDQAATTAYQDAAAADTKEVKITYPDREVIYRRGERLTPSRLELLEAAIVAEGQALLPWQKWSSRLALVGVTAAIALAVAGYTALFCSRIRRNMVRMMAVVGLLAGAAAVACIATAYQPGLIALTAAAPTVFVAVILVIAYDQRVALAFGSLHGILVCTALDQPISLYAIMVAGIGVAVWSLKEIRDRDSLIRMGVFEAFTLAAGTMVASLVDLPINRATLAQAGLDAGLAGFAGLLVGGVTLFILPTLERLFDITTGMTLVELRDPKQPLLRELQQRAPGTYNHSLNLAALAEAAADAINADGLLAYVGALYHDIGKMNKPEYFVENQTPGINKHDKLSPAMSLLIIVGHVKDGMELAREFNLPRPLWHFIESHHGTTLVEFFYHRARRQAEAGSAGAWGRPPGSEAPPPPTELEYRYPGPKPRHKEAAIVMLCDAVEGASRAMADPTSSRIDAMVRAIATKRLMDGQFDECDITLRELNTIVETVSKTLASMYHGRIAYPTLTPGGAPLSDDTAHAAKSRPPADPGTGTLLIKSGTSQAPVTRLSNGTPEPAEAAVRK